MVNKDLAGGALLDLGVYALTWVFQTMYHTLPKEKRVSPNIVNAAMAHDPRTGADIMTSMIVSFPRTTPSGLDRPAHAVALTAMDIDDNPDNKGTAGPVVRVHGTKGEIQVFGPSYRPSHVRIIPAGATEYRSSGPVKEAPESGVIDKTFDFPGGHGMFWEADEAARCVRDGKLESEGLDWDESIAIMEVMDKVREAGGLTYPEVIETTKYPVDLKAK